MSQPFELLVDEIVAAELAQKTVPDVHNLASNLHTLYPERMFAEIENAVLKSIAVHGYGVWTTIPK